MLYNTTIHTHIGESAIYSKFACFFKLHSYLLRIATFTVCFRSNEEEEGATLEKFVDSSILELLLNETEDEKDIIYKINW